MILSRPVLLGFEPRRARPKPVEALGDNGEAGLGDGVVEPHHDVAGLDEVAVANARSSPTTPPVGMLDFLDVGIDHDRARRDQRAGYLRRRCPAAETAGENEDDGKPDDQMQPDRRLRAFRCLVVHDFATPASETILIGEGGADPLQHLSQNRFLGAEGLHAAVLENQQLIDRLDGDRPMRDHDRRCRRARAPRERPGQRLVALGIEIGIRLVEHDQERIAVQRPGQCHALRLAGRKRRALSPIWVS